MCLACMQVRDNPIWFVAFVWCEVVIQLPFFIIAAYAYISGESACDSRQLHPYFTCQQHQHQQLWHSRENMHRSQAELSYLTRQKILVR